MWWNVKKSMWENHYMGITWIMVLKKAGINNWIDFGKDFMKINKLSKKYESFEQTENKRIIWKNQDGRIMTFTVYDSSDVSGLHSKVQWESDWTRFKQRLTLTCVYVTWGSAEVMCPHLLLSGASADMWALFLKHHLREGLNLVKRNSH